MALARLFLFLGAIGQAMATVVWVIVLGAAVLCVAGAIWEAQRPPS